MYINFWPQPLRRQGFEVASLEDLSLPLKVYAKPFRDFQKEHHTRQKIILGITKLTLDYMTRATKGQT